METAKQEEVADEEKGPDKRCCVVNKILLPLKIFYFFYFGAVGSMIPYLTVYLQHLNVTAAETGLITGLSVLAAFLLRLALGMLADCLHARRLLLVICCLLFGSAFSSLWFVPARPAVDRSCLAFQCRPDVGSQDGCLSSRLFESSADMAMECLLRQHKVAGTLDTLHTADTVDILYTPDTLDTLHTFLLADCGMSRTRLKMKILSRDLEVVNVSLDDSHCFQTVAESRGEFKLLFKDNPLEHRPKSANLSHKRFLTAVHLTCAVGKHSFETAWDTTGKIDIMTGKPSVDVTTVKTVHNLRSQNVALHQTPVPVPRRQRDPWNPSPSPRQGFPDSFSAHLQCNYSCTDDTESSESPAFMLDFSFCLSLILICVGRAFYSSSNSLSDTVTYGMLGDRHQWGRQRMWGSLGTFLVALIFTTMNDSLAGGGFSVQFTTFCCLIVLTCSAVRFLGTPGSSSSAGNNTTARTRRRSTESSIIPQLRSLVSQAAVKVFLVKLLLLGMFSGSVQNFTFWFLRELGSNQTILGACLLANCLSTVVVLRFSAPIMKKLGETRTMYLAFPAYCVRFVGLSMIPTPWMAVPLEVLHGVTYSLLWASASATTHLLAPNSSRATCQSFAGAVYWDMGRGLGTVLTGQLFRAVGGRWTFRGYGAVAVFMFPVCVMLDRLWPLPGEKTQGNGKPPTLEGTMVCDDGEHEDALRPLSAHTHPHQKC